MSVIWGLANPMVGDCKVTQALLTHDHHLIHAGRVNLGDEGLAGRNFERFITEGLETPLRQIRRHPAMD
jgi:hypothetical protein